jgi:hypothetical protein
MPIGKVEREPVYQAMLQKLYWMGINPQFNQEDLNTSIISVDFIYQDIFPKLIVDGMRIEGLDCWIELDKSVLDEHNKIDVEDTRTLRDYVLNYLENDTTCLIRVSHCDIGSKSRTGTTTSEELYAFIDKYGDDTLSNVFVETSVIESKKLEYQNEMEL